MVSDKLRILITGGNGYVAKSLLSSLSTEKSFVLESINRKVVDLENRTAVDSWFQGKNFDVVIHTATVGGSRLQTEDELVFTRNVSMYENMMQHKDRFAKFISFGSGAEINPTTPYGRSKRYIADSMKDFSFCHNIRIFGVFDHNELPSRFIKSNILRCFRDEPIIVHQNKLMDFFYMNDLCRLFLFITQKPVRNSEANKSRVWQQCRHYLQHS
jgi:nucleoside-diphosphate-sugar epimerase